MTSIIKSSCFGYFGTKPFSYQRQMVSLLLPLCLLVCGGITIASDPTNNGPDLGNQDKDSPTYCVIGPRVSDESAGIRQPSTSHNGLLDFSGLGGGVGQPRLGSAPMKRTKWPINLMRGSVSEIVTDISLPGPTIGWSHTRSYDSRWVKADGGTELPGPNGIRWESDAVGPFVSHTSSSTDPCFCTAAGALRVFNSSLQPPPGYEATLAREGSGDNDLFTLKHTRTGEIFEFHGWNVNDEHKRGRLKRARNRRMETEAENGVQYSYNNDGCVSTVTGPQGWLVTYSYEPSGAESGRLQKVEVKAGPYESSETIKKVEYTYYSSPTGGAPSPSTDCGDTGDLIQVKVSVRATMVDPQIVAWQVFYTQYRYYRSGSSNGRQHQLKMVLEPEVIERILQSGDSAVDTPAEIMSKADSYDVNSSGNTIEEFASRKFTYYTSDTSTTSINTPWATGENLQSKYGGSDADEYDASNGHGKVKTETINGACGGCGGGSGNGITNSYFYMTLNSGSGNLSVVRQIVVEDAEDADSNAVKRTIYGLNEQGVALRQAIIENPTAGTLKAWCDSLLVDSEGRVTQQRFPSIHAGEVVNNADVAMFLNPTSGSNDTATLNSTGLRHIFEYNVTGGNLTWTAQSIQRGSSTAYYNSYTAFGDGSSNKPRWAVVETRVYDTQVASSPVNGGIATTYSYTFHDPGGDTQIRQKTTTQPSISTSENGSGTAVATYEYFDELGRLRWTKDGEGYVTYHSYDPETGGLSYTMEDVDTGSLASDITSGSTGKWLAWTGAAALTRAGTEPAPLQLVTKVEYDSQSRETLLTNPAGEQHHMIYEAPNNRVLRFPHWKSTASERLVPIEATESNDAGNPTAIYTIDPDQATAYSGVPTGLSGTTTQEHYISLSRLGYDTLTGQLIQVDRYHDIPSSGVGTLSTNYYRTIHQYDKRGRREYEIDVVSGTTVGSSKEQVTKTSYDVLDRVEQVSRAVSSDSHSMGSSYTTYPTPKTITAAEYDGTNVGDGHVTKRKRFFADTSFSGENLHYDFRGNLRGIEPISTSSSVAPFTVIDYDWMGHAIARTVYSTNQTWLTVTGDDDYAATQTTNREQHFKTFYDDLGRLYRSETHVVAGGTLHGILRTDRYYDRRNLLVAEQLAHSAAKEYAHDGVGRPYQTRIVSDLSTTKFSGGGFSYRAPVPKPDLTSMSGGNQNVLELVHEIFDSSGNSIVTYRFEMNHNDTNGIYGVEQGSAQDWIRHTIYRWYDTADRITDAADYGSSATNDEWAYGAPPGRSTPPTASSATVLLTEYAYNADSGRLEEVVDPADKKAASFYDDLGRLKYEVANFVNFNPSTEASTGGGTNAADDQVVKRVYDGLDNVIQLIALDQNGNGTANDNEVTEYKFEDAYDARFATKTIYPDSSGGTDFVTIAYALDGLPTQRTDQRGVIIDYTYNTSRLLEWEKATIPNGVADDTVKAIKREYDSLRRRTYVTSYGAVDGTSPKNQFRFLYEYGTYQVTMVHQDHDSNQAGSSPFVRTYYDNSKDGSNLYDDGYRAYLFQYPSGKYVLTDYVSTYSDRLHRVDRMRGEHQQTGTFPTLAEYGFNGTGRLVSTKYAVPDVTSKYDEHATGDKVYENLDRFGRVKAKTWKDGSTIIDKYIYTYDYAGNRLTRDNTLASGRDQKYAYDGLHRLIDTDQGTLSGGTITSKNFEQNWSHDALGNWTTLQQDNDGNGTWELSQLRGHNAANELTAINLSATHVALDGAGNMTKVPKPTSWSAHYDLKYDAWNRLVEVKDGANTVATYQYDGIGRRIVKTASGVTDHYYYDHNWRCFEVRRGSETGTSIEAYVWHPQYIDALAVRYYDKNTDQDYLDTNEIQYVLQDANYNVTGLTDTTGAVQERYVYTPYGEATVLNGSWGTQSSPLDNPYTYTGRRLDPETGLYQYRHRYYHAQLGRFVTRDPIGYEGSQWNLYEYVGGGVMNGLDPLGLFDPGNDSRFDRWVQQLNKDRQSWRNLRDQKFNTHLARLRDTLNAHCEGKFSKDDCGSDLGAASDCKNEVNRIIDALKKARSRILEGLGPVRWRPWWTDDVGVSFGMVCNECDDVVEEELKGALDNALFFRQRSRERDAFYDHRWREITTSDGYIITIDFWHDPEEFWAIGEDPYGYHPTDD